MRLAPLVDRAGAEGLRAHTGSWCATAAAAACSPPLCGTRPGLPSCCMASACAAAASVPASMVPCITNKRTRNLGTMSPASCLRKNKGWHLKRHVSASAMH